MHTIKLKIEDNIYKNIMFILQNLQLKGLEIEEIYEKTSTKTKVKELFSTKNVDTFNTIDNPMLWQEQQRNEW